MTISLSWLDLKPNEVKNGNEEDFEDYYPRIKSKEEYSHIPESVFEQWIHPHHQKWETLHNYAWLDYKKITFEEQSWTFEKLAKVNVIPEYMDFYLTRTKFDNFDDFLLGKENLSFWKQNGTWKTPPIILDVNSLKSNIPMWSKIRGPYQLVEGHTRLGHLNSMKKVSDLSRGQISQTHKIWLMQEI